MKLLSVHPGSCHCGAVRFEVDLPRGLEDVGRCDCSYCRRLGFIYAAVPLDGLRVTHGADRLTLYQFNTFTARHYFCPVCGVSTHHQRRSNPEEYGFNIGCLDGVNPFELGEVPVFDGVHHPSDREPGSG